MHTQLIIKVEDTVGEIKEIIMLDEQGCTSQVQKIFTDKTCYLLKSSFKEKYREWLHAEATVLERLNKSGGIPVPKYYGLIEEKESSHLLMSFEDGITLTTALNQAKSTTEKKSLIRSFGHFLRELHESDLIESLNHELDWLDTQLVKAENYIQSGQTDGSSSLLKTLKSNKPHPVAQTLIHGDCTTDNVLVVEGKVQLFIDVAGMTVGDTRYDESLAIRSFLSDEEYLKSFYEGYRRYQVSKEEFKYFDEGLYEFFLILHLVEGQ